MEMMMMMEKYECVFCGKPVKKDITALLAITGWELSEEEQQSQQFFCHLECLKKVMNNHEMLYIESFCK